MAVDKKTNKNLQRVKANSVISYNLANPNQKPGLIAYLQRAKEANGLVMIALRSVTEYALKDLPPPLSRSRPHSISFPERGKSKDLGPLVNLKKLLWFELRNTEVIDVRPLVALSNLNHLLLRPTAQNISRLKRAFQTL